MQEMLSCEFKIGILLVSYKSVCYDKHWKIRNIAWYHRKELLLFVKLTHMIPHNKGQRYTQE